MCGIGGLFGVQKPDTQSILRMMGDKIRSRGPDGSGIFFDGDSDIGMVHQRLSIIDLSSEGHQPMFSACKRYVMVFNGEIYNHLDLRRKLEISGYADGWRGRSDTETLLAAISAWGLHKAIKESIGMFSIALWDNFNRELSLVRDRIGEKPLYYGWLGKGFGFASELKALVIFPGFHREIDRNALSLFMRYSYVPAPKSIYSDIFKLKPGSILTINLKHLKAHSMPDPVYYWSATSIAYAGIENEHSFNSLTAATDKLEDCLRESIRSQMVADVPVGAFLSGGVDSSTIVSLMQAEALEVGSPAVKTFTIGFLESDFDEAKRAKAIAKFLGTDHSEWYINSKDALNIIPELPDIYDEPFADSSQLPTCLVSRMAREQVKVILTGDGGDELFCGYGRYIITEKIWKKISRIPYPLRKSLSRLIREIPVSRFNRMYEAISSILPRGLLLDFPGDKIHKGSYLFEASNVSDFYHRLISHCESSSLVLGNLSSNSPYSAALPNLPKLIDQMMLRDTLSYLPDDILVKVDRAAMSVGLESRVPMLDHRVVEFAWQLPKYFKYRSGDGKWLLRQVLNRYVPPHLTNASKMGFAIPLGLWLRGPLRQWAENLLSESRLRNDGYFNYLEVRQRWAEHISGQRNWQYLLWNVLMFNAWLDNR